MRSEARQDRKDDGIMEDEVPPKPLDNSMDAIMRGRAEARLRSINGVGCDGKTVTSTKAGDSLGCSRSRSIIRWMQ